MQPPTTRVYHIYHGGPAVDAFVPEVNLDCSYCGKPVLSTIHRRSGGVPYEVGYFRLLTGDLQLIGIQKPGEENEIVEFFKLLNPRWVVACPFCFADDKIQAELTEQFEGIPAVTEAERAATKN